MKLISMLMYSNMEFANRKACVEHYQEQFPRLPRYMIEMALDYDLAQDGASNEKPLTGRQKRKQKQVKKEQEPVKRELNQTIQEALEKGKPLEIDCAKVLKAEEYEMPPFMKGHIEVDGGAVAAQMDKEPTEEIEEFSILEEF